MVPNPCSASIEVRFVAAGRAGANLNQADAYKIGSHQVRTLKNAIPDVGRTNRALVTAGEGKESAIEIPAHTPDPFVLVVPAESC
jgi:hypothetical protein